MTKVASVFMSSMGSHPDKEELETFTKSSQFNKEKMRFVNRRPNITSEQPIKKDGFGFSNFIEFLGKGNGRYPDKPLPMLKPDMDKFLEKSDVVKSIWFGHSTVLFNIDSKIVLIDPIFSDSSSPVPIFVKRFGPTLLTLKELPKIDYILISHDHYDHLDTTTLKKIKNKKNITVICPLKLSKTFISLGYKKVIELDWYNENKNINFDIMAIPAYHWSRRLGQKYNSTLWNGYTISYQSKKIFFSGDTAFGPMFSKIGEKLGPFDLSIISIGAYKPRGMMQASHCTPEEAVGIASMLSSKNILGMHWGTIRLSAEDPWEPPIKFKKAAQLQGYQAHQIWQLSIGETKSLI